MGHVLSESRPGRSHCGSSCARTRAPGLTGLTAWTPLKVALLGCGVVGTEVARLLTEQADDLAARVGARWSSPASPSPAGARPPRPAASTARCSPTTPQALVTRADVDIVVEVIGGIEPARVADPRRAGGTAASVVTANKALLAEDGADAVRRGRRSTASTSTTRPPWPAPSRCCARCASRWPATGVRRVLGIVNGTTNFILTGWTATGAGFAEALEEAQALGYAEADPTADVEGFDAAAKAAILASLAFHTRVTAADVHREGITEVTAADIAARPGDGLRRQAAGHLRGSHRRTAASASACTRR